MRAAGFKPRENHYAFLLREAAGRGAFEEAFVHILDMVDAGVSPRLRSYTPLLRGLCSKVGGSFMICSPSAGDHPPKRCGFWAVLLHRGKVSVAACPVRLIAVPWFFLSCLKGVARLPWGTRSKKAKHGKHGRNTLLPSLSHSPYPPPITSRI